MPVGFVKQTEFNSTPELLTKYGTYEKYLLEYVNSLSNTSLMTFAKEHAEFRAFNLADRIRNSIWSASKQADEAKGKAQELYWKALVFEDAASAERSVALSNYDEAKAAFKSGSKDITEKEYETFYNKYLTADSNARSAESTRSILGEKMVDASKASEFAFFNGMVADKTLIDT